MGDKDLYAPFWGKSGILELPYSAHENVLAFVPPGFDRTLKVKFPDTRLPVCEMCKKSFKTRDMCRVRNCHVDPPWSTSYVCLLLDGSCTDRNGAYVDEPLVARTVPHLDFVMERPFLDPGCPVCAACKKANRTRSSCREKHMHGELPWNSIYAILSTDGVAVKDNPKSLSPPSEKLVGYTKEPPSENDKRQETCTASQGNIGSNISLSILSLPNFCSEDHGMEEASPHPRDLPDNPMPPEKVSPTTLLFESHDIYDVHESRAFLIKIGNDQISLQWLKTPDTNGKKRKRKNSIGSHGTCCSRDSHTADVSNSNSLPLLKQEGLTVSQQITPVFNQHQEVNSQRASNLAAHQLFGRSGVYALLAQHQNLLQQQEQLGQTITQKLLALRNLIGGGSLRTSSQGIPILQRDIILQQINLLQQLNQQSESREREEPRPNDYNSDCLSS